MWSGRHCREDEGSKVEMIWTRNKKRWRACQTHKAAEDNEHAKIRVSPRLDAINIRASFSKWTFHLLVTADT